MTRGERERDRVSSQFTDSAFSIDTLGERVNLHLGHACRRTRVHLTDRVVELEGEYMWDNSVELQVERVRAREERGGSFLYQSTP